MILMTDCSCDAMWSIRTVKWAKSLLPPEVTINDEHLIFFSWSRDETKIVFNCRVHAKKRGLVEGTSPSPSFTSFWEALKHDHVWHKMHGGVVYPTAEARSIC